MPDSKSWAFGAVLLSSLFVGKVSAQVAVVVHPHSSTSGLSTDQVASMFLGKTLSLPGGLSLAVDLPEGTAPRDQFYSKAAGKTAAQVKATWARLTFTGKAAPPKELASAAEVKKFVAANVDAIGYIDKASVDGTIRVVLTLD